MELTDCIIARHEDLVHDLATGEITFDPGMPEEMKDKLRAAFRAAPERAELLSSIFSAGDTKDLLARIWPGLGKIIAAGTGTFEIYRDDLKRYIGGAEYSNGFLASAEAIMGIAVKMYEDNAYIEFLPVSDSQNGTVLSDEVKIGEKYLIYVTTYSGLYRYCVGDIVEITDVKDGIPYFRYAGRADEKTPVHEIYHAVRAAAEEKKVSVNDFFCEEKEDGSLILHLETREPEKIDLDAFAGALPEKLRICSIKTIPFGAQYSYKHRRVESGNMASDQLKPVRYLSAEDRAAISSSSSSR